MRTFCEIIRGLREDRDLKQSDVAAILGTSQQYYSKYETGKYEMPVRHILILADFYGVSTDYLLAGRTPPHPSATIKSRCQAEARWIGCTPTCCLWGRTAAVPYGSMSSCKSVPAGCDPHA